MPTTINSLPPETLSSIYSYLSSTHSPGVYAFCQTNKHCYSASHNARFAQIRIRVKSRQSLSDAIKTWDGILSDNLAYGAVRALIVEGRVAPHWENTSTSAGAGFQEDPFKDYAVEDEFTQLGAWYDAILRGPFYHLGVGEDASDAAWKPLADLLVNLKGLRSFTYAFERRLPQCLLTALRAHGDRCKLHIKALDPPVLSEEQEEDEEGKEEVEEEVEDDELIEKYDYALVTTPVLCSAVVSVAYDDSHRRNNEEAARLMATGLSPNLRALHIVDSGPGFKYRPMTRGLSIKDEELLSRRRVIEEIQKKNLQLLGQLDVLSLDPANLPRFQKWEQTVDFSRLCSLQLWRVRFETLKQAATCDFTSLKTLLLGLYNPRTQFDPDPQDRATRSFLQKLPPLESLHITGPFFQRTIGTATMHHGESLQKLSLYPSATKVLAQYRINARIVREIQKTCPNLYDLRLHISRSQGDQEEQETYKALGTLRNLRHLSLHLNVFERPNFALLELSHPLDNSIVKGALMNMAVDAELANEIFCLIARGSTIESLSLTLAMNIEQGPLWDMFQMMKRQWKCTRISAPPELPRAAVQELGATMRKRRGESHQFTPKDEYMEAFRELWPSKTAQHLTTDDGYDSWKDDWHSFPLQNANGRHDKAFSKTD
ncbi:uncharacterized protein BDV14DRAFT_200169 [Aspergillus stella-maris]|uniref:uncharacterized protein n=1 Tax=Aspergillus stella-maris TaxID=1810926 RepID=UPI003CCD8CE0